MAQGRTPLDYDRLMRAEPIPSEQQLTARETILYALGVGAGGADAADDLTYVYEERLKALPTLATVLATPGLWVADPKYGLDWRMSLHGEESVEIHAPLPVEGRLLGETRIDEVYDKGADKGALLCFSRKIWEGATGQLLATVRQRSLFRANGGFAPRPQSAGPGRPPPQGAPDLTFDATSRADQALIYRLSGDLNPLHIDPAAARAAGFQRPILHGLCTYGIAGRVLVAGLMDNAPERLRRLDVRFAAPVYPGESLELRVWRDSPGSADFMIFAKDRGTAVITNGWVTFDA